MPLHPHAFAPKLIGLSLYIRCMNYYKTDEILEIFKKSIIGYDYVIEKLYLENGLSALKDLDLALLACKDDFNGKETIERHLEDKISFIEKDLELKRAKLELDIENLKLTKEYINAQKKELENAPKQRTWNLIITSSVAILAAGLTSLLSYMAQQKPQDVILNPTVLPTIQIVHDTVYTKHPLNAVKTSTRK